VRLCPVEALTFLPKRLANVPKRDRLAKKMIDLETRSADIPAMEAK
jgi:hypothetical protein